MTRKPKSRPSLRILADKILDGVVHRQCPKCQEHKPLDAFGLRRMAGRGEDGGTLVTNQSWCRACRFPATWGSKPTPQA